MLILEIIFWVALAVILYTYIGYALVVWVWAKCIAIFKKKAPLAPYEPDITLVVPAYNEANILEEKINKCLALDYPQEKLSLIFITDGSTDHSEEVMMRYPKILHLHIPERGGKSLAENRAMDFVNTPYVIFTDCNAMLNSDAIKKMARHYQNPEVGAVSGEKKIMQDASGAAAGEGLYWKYESFLKRSDATIYSLMGAAGELVSFRSALFQPLEKDTILDDFIQSLRIVEKGYQVVYEPEAYAMESSSISIREEMKRKIRICAGGWQSMGRLQSLLNPLTNPKLTFLYVSHRVLRWSLTPLFLAILLPLNFALSITLGGIYTASLVLQVLFYAAAWAGWLAELKGAKIKPLVVPLYFSMMNIAVFAGFYRYIYKTQPAAWEKAERAVSGSKIRQ